MENIKLSRQISLGEGKKLEFKEILPSSDKFEIIRNIERQKQNISFDEEISYVVDIKSLNIEKLKEDFSRLTNKKMDENTLQNINLTKVEGKNIYPTNGLILLSTDTTTFEYARIRCARFKGNDISEFIDQKEFSGPLYEQVDNAIRFAKQYIPKSGVIGDVQRIDSYQIPIIAIREAIVNAVVHRDYSIIGADIKLAIFDDRLEITSPGALPKTLDIEDILEGRSEIRNRVIARFFKEINYIEQWGTGVRRIIKECDDKGLIFPSIKEGGNYFKIVLYAQSDIGEVPVQDKKMPISEGEVPIKDEKMPVNTGEVPINDKKMPISTGRVPIKEELILTYLQQNEFITNRIAREQIGLKETATKNLLKQMCDKKILMPIGNGKGRQYIIYKSQDYID